jgi:hypothetical protein
MCFFFLSNLQIETPHRASYIIILVHPIVAYECLGLELFVYAGAIVFAEFHLQVKVTERLQSFVHSFLSYLQMSSCFIDDLVTLVDLDINHLIYFPQFIIIMFLFDHTLYVKVHNKQYLVYIHQTCI